MTNNLSYSHSLLAVYGSLRIGQQANHRLQNDSFKYIGPNKILGTLFPVGWFPGLLLFGDTEIIVDVYEILDEQGLNPINQYEGYYTSSKIDSLFTLETTTLIDTKEETYCYEYNGNFRAAGNAIEHGDWAKYLSEKEESRESFFSECDSC